MILPAFTNAREFLGQHALSYSEMQAITHCENKWDLIYNTKDREEYPSTPQMELGTLLHARLNCWWGHGSGDLCAEENETADWLMDRYDEVYHGTNMEMIAVNVPFAVQYGGTWLFGWFDGIIQDTVTKDLWVYEAKSMGNWTRLNQLPKDKQVTLYIYAARRSGYDVKGVMYDALLTTVWKTQEGEVYKSGPRKGEPKDYHPPADSFRQEFVVRTDEEIEQFLFEVDSIVSRRTELFWRWSMPMLNVGQACDRCPVQPQCFGIDLTLMPDDVTLNF